MKKIPTLFVRDPEDRKHVTRDVTPGCEWVIAGEGEATRKFDGTCIMLDDDGCWWARREVKPGKTPPDNFVPISTDDNTGKTVGWEPIEQSGFHKWFQDAGQDWRITDPGTYELCGPKINGNPEGFLNHEIIPHGEVVEDDFPRTFDDLRNALGHYDGEGIVWHHPDGRMAKLKGRDFS